MSMQELFEKLPDDILDQIESIENKPYTNGRHIKFKNGYMVSVQWGIGLHNGLNMWEQLQQVENELPHPHGPEEYFDAWFNTPRDAPMAEMMIIAPDESWLMVNDSEPIMPDEIVRLMREVMGYRAWKKV